MSAEEKKSDLKQQFRGMAQGSQSLAVAYIGIVNGLFSALSRATHKDSDALAAAAMDAAYVRRWCDAAYAFGYLDVDGDVFSLAASGAAMLPGAPESLMPMAVQAVLNMHMAERGAALMRTGERPGEKVMAECETLMPWFGQMLESGFAPFFEQTICPAIPIFAEVNSKGGLAVDFGCGNGCICARSSVIARPCGGLDSTVSTRMSPRRRGLPRRRGWATGCASLLETRMISRWKARPISSP